MLAKRTLTPILLIALIGLSSCRPPEDQPPADRDHRFLPDDDQIPAIADEFRRNLHLPLASQILDVGDLLRRLCHGTLRRAGSLDARLAQCGPLRAAIVWETATGDYLPYDSWTPAQRSRLDALFQALVREEVDLGLSCPDPARSYSLRRAPDGGATIFLTAAEAFDIYAAHVAHALYLEATAAVPWSLYSLPAQELAELLSSDRYHSRILPSTRDSATDPYYPSHIRPERDYQLTYMAYGITGRALNCDPRVGYRFVRGDASTSGEDLLRDTEERTLANLTRWFADNVAHGGDPEDLTPENRVSYSYLEDRLKAQLRDHGWVSYTLIIAVHGCHSASNLLHDLARSINLPLLRMFSYDGGAHQGLAFRWARRDPRFLHHVDDIYANQMNLSFPLAPGDARPGAEQATQMFFDGHWSPPARLGSQGFRLTGDYSLQSPSLVRENFDHPNVGVFGGEWESPEAAGGYRLEQQYRLGVWQNYLEFYCNSVSQFDFEIGRRRIAGSRPLSEHRDRAAAAVAAWGGCEELTRLATDYTDSVRGSNVWRE